MYNDDENVETVETNEGTLPVTVEQPVEVTNVNPQGVDVGTNALELQNDPTPGTPIDPDVPASAVVHNDPTPTADRSTVFTSTDGTTRKIEGDYITDFVPGNVVEDTDSGEEYTQDLATEDNDFQGVIAEVVPEGEETLEKPRRYSRS